ncbi:hypothetical protein PG993_010571 [Apiospora rasikravindrae]|uniref:Lysine-specific metallo-endopeptidase domain-containing protein n=1 Tax=Apiospora rasikravindrae TaxID=990691 RepID=A0ABR1SMR0_9PEZI
MFFGKYVLPALVPLFILAILLPVFSQEPDSSGYSTLLVDDSCDGNQTETIRQAHRDAADMAHTALEIAQDEPSSIYRYAINWNSTAAIDYFGSPSSNFAYREHILRTLTLASRINAGWSNSGGDNSQSRPIKVTCNDPRSRCGIASTAYTDNGLDQKYPLVNYCPGFFQDLSSHSDAWHKMRDGPAPPDAWHNVRNLRSQASTALHELLHINSSWPSNVCAGGCADTLQDLDGGREMVWTYRAGLAKLLARRDVRAAAQTADNYVYYAMSRWMEVKDAAQYPPLPLGMEPGQIPTVERRQGGGGAWGATASRYGSGGYGCRGRAAA